ncbi:MAG: DUF1611 domain-containing protein, partial [Halorubrum sp.]
AVKGRLVVYSGDDATAADAVADFGGELGVPAADPVRDGAGAIVDGIVEAGLGGTTAATDGGADDERSAGE